MAQKIITTCDQCNDECDYYISIEKGSLRCANGGKSNIPSGGFVNIGILDKVFCSIVCMLHWHEDESDKDQLGSYFPGDQIGQKALYGIMDK